MRIRTVKPAFWSDAKVKRLSDHTALFFISLWNVADDYGYFPLDTLELSLKVCRWRSQEVFKMLRALVDAGLVRCSGEVGVGLIEGWSHQRIDRPRVGKYNHLEIQWDNALRPANCREDSTLDRIGKDRIGKDGIGSIPATPKKRGSPTEKTSANIPTKEVVTLPSEDPSRDLNQRIWQRYETEYAARWKSPPVRNATVNSQVSQLGKRLGADAPDVIAFYVWHNDEFFVRQCHPVGLCLAQAESLRTQWANNVQVTRGQARMADDSQTRQTVWDRAADRVTAHVRDKSNGQRSS